MSASPESARWADLGVRTVSAIVLVPLALLAAWAGEAWFTVAMALLGVLIAHEYVAIVHRGNPTQFGLHTLGALCGAILATEAGAIASLVAILLCAAVSASLLLGQTETRTAWSFLGVIYAALPGMAFVLLRHTPDWGLTALVWLMVAVWAADSLAYFAGRTLGGPKLAPRISPKKTWSGLGGAVMGAGIGGWLVAWLSGLPLSLPLAIAGALLGVVEQGGDLFKSALKRRYGIKDTGTLIPGHGGVIDRVDGLIAASLVALTIGLIRAGPAAPAAGLLLW